MALSRATSSGSSRGVRSNGSQSLRQHSGRTVTIRARSPSAARGISATIIRLRPSVRGGLRCSGSGGPRDGRDGPLEAMCGIAGIVDFDGRVEGALLDRMCAVMEHRGPDSRGVFVENGVGLGVQRLAIIDVAGGDQPIFNEDRSIAVVLNGEIYNYAELREQLIRNGHRFSSRSDTEVLVHLYEDRGADMVSDLHGMFAFAIW